MLFFLFEMQSILQLFMGTYVTTDNNTRKTPSKMSFMCCCSPPLNLTILLFLSFSAPPLLLHILVPFSLHSPARFLAIGLSSLFWCFFALAPTNRRIGSAPASWVSEGICAFLAPFVSPLEIWFFFLTHNRTVRQRVCGQFNNPLQHPFSHNQQICKK